MYKIAVMPGDGTGPEVTVEAVKVLKAAAGKFGFKMDLTEFDFGGEHKRAEVNLSTYREVDRALVECRGLDGLPAVPLQSSSL